ncbi:Armadillo repeat-containing kinesin-like protein 2 [Hibiscus syriacus]|uniref:Vacuolar protein 8 n=1 Tax=Hibiscus syriacus TaxID=106335 RepID=A0A6A3BVK2_HIBSY|nr:Armadillo repeat-containing kinesin-like protein 2 [Hibiscus syriacus]
MDRGPSFSVVDDVAEVKKLLEKEIHMRKDAEEGVSKRKSQLRQCTDSGEGGDSEILKLQQALADKVHQKKKLEEEMIVLRSQMLQLTFEADQMRKSLGRNGSTNAYSALESPMSQVRGSLNGHKTPVAVLFEQVGPQKILALLESEDVNVRIHAVKVVANLAAEEANRERIVEAAGLTSLLMLLRSYEDETIRRVVAGAIANLAMNVQTAFDPEDPQTLRMVAGAIANLCGNDKLQAKLRSEGGIKALLGMVRCGHPDVLSQVALGIASFAKCESRASTNGDTLSLHCHLAQREVNVKDMISGGALWELVRISRYSSREDIRSLARRTLNSSPVFRAEMRRLGIEL